MILSGKVEKIELFNFQQKETVLVRIKVRVRGKIWKLKVGPTNQFSVENMKGCQKFDLLHEHSNGFWRANWIEPDDFSDDELFDAAVQATKRQRLEA